MGYTVPKINVSNLLNAGRSARELFGSVRQDELANAKMAEEQRRWDIANDRLQRKEDRELAEQEALDKYFGIISQGEQVKGGVLNKDSLIAEADKYSFTPEEIAKYDAYKGDAAAARAAGDTGLADKIDWQTNLSRVADKIPESGVANEGRVAMYERARDEVAKAGLPVSKEMAAAVDTARFKEKEAEREKKKHIEEQLAKLSEKELEMQKYYGNKIGGGSSFVDEDGNTVSLGSRNKSAKDQTTSIIKGTTALSKAVNALEGLDATEKKDAAKIATDTFNIIVSRGVDPTAAAEFIDHGLSTKDTGFLFWAGKEPKINTDMVNQFVDTYKVTEAKLGAGGGTSVSRNTEKEDYARDLLALTMQGNAAKRAKLQGDLDALNMTSDERMEAGLTELLRKNGVLPSARVETAAVAPNGYEAAVKKVESGSLEGNYNAVNKNSGAIGAYQFLPSTLNDFRGRFGNPNFTDEEFKSNPALQDKIFQQFTRMNENILRNRGIEVNDYTRWLAHNLGAGNVKDFVEGKQTPGLTKAISAQFGGKKSSIADYNERFAKEFTGVQKANTNIDKDALLAMFDAAPGKEVSNADTEEDTNTNKVKDLFSKVKTNEEKSISESKDPLYPVISKENAGTSPFKGDGRIVLNTSEDVKGLVSDLLNNYAGVVRDVSGNKSIMDRVNDLDKWVRDKSYNGTDFKSSINDMLVGPNRLDEQEQHNRRLSIADKVMEGEQLTKAESNWIEQSKKTPGGRAILEKYGIIKPKSDVYSPITAIFPKEEDMLLKDIIRQYHLQQQLSDPAYVYDRFPTISDEVKDMFRVLQADLKSQRELKEK